MSATGFFEVPYKLPASISTGSLALMVDAQKSRAILYGREENGVLVSDDNAFHAWVECNGWLIDFMAPIMGSSLLEDGHDWHLPRRMLQKPLKNGKDNINEIRHNGEFFISHDPDLAELLIDKQSAQFADLLNVCLTWFHKPPKPLNDITLADNLGSMKKLVLLAPSIDGVW